MVDIIFFVHFSTGREIVLIRNTTLDYIDGFEKRVKEYGCTEMITWAAFDKEKKIVKSGVINKEE